MEGFTQVRKIVLLGLLFTVHCEGQERMNFTADVTYSKYNDPACLMEEITFTCSIVGRKLIWFLDNVPVKTYTAADTCGNFTSSTGDNYSFDFLLGSNIETGNCTTADSPNCYYNCTSLMMMTANMPGPVTINCSTVDPQDNNTITNDSISFEVLGPSGPNCPENVRVYMVACDSESSMKLFNISWDATNNIQNLENYTVIVMNGPDNNIFTDVLHPSLSSTLMAIPSNVESPEFIVETYDKCQGRNRHSLNPSESFSCSSGAVPLLCKRMEAQQRLLLGFIIFNIFVVMLQ